MPRESLGVGHGGFQHGRGVELSIGADNLSYVLFSRCECLALEGSDLLNAVFCQLEHLIKLFSIKRGAFGGTLHFDKFHLLRHDNVHVRVALGVLGVFQVEYGLPLKDTNRNRGDHVLERAGGKGFFIHQVV